MNLEELGHLVETYRSRRQTRLDAQKLMENAKRLEMEAEQEIISAMISHGIGSIGDSTTRVTRQIKLRPHAENWGEIDDYIRESGNTAILQRRLHEGHINELKEDGINVPGVSEIEINRLTVSKVKK